MASPPRISALIIAKDEERNLDRCLATLGWVDEVVIVVDASSRDDTLEIARRRADRVIIRRFDNYAAQRNAALKEATGDWVFTIDADERATPQLAAHIRSVVADRSLGFAGYRIPIQSVILGRRFRYSGTQDDRPLRLFRRRVGRWTGAVHETVLLRGTVGTLNRPMLHKSLTTVDVFLRKLNRYTTLEALQAVKDKRSPQKIDLVVRPLLRFAKLYFLKKGYKDGPEGLLFCALSGVSVAVAHWKHLELSRGQVRLVRRSSRLRTRSAA